MAKIKRQCPFKVVNPYGCMWMILVTVAGVVMSEAWEAFVDAEGVLSRKQLDERRDGRMAW